MVGIDAFKVGRLKGTTGDVWQLTAIDIYSSFGRTELVVCPTGNPNDKQTSRFARRIARDLHDAGWRLERVLTDNDSALLRARRRNTGEAPPRGAGNNWQIGQPGRHLTSTTTETESVI